MSTNEQQKQDLSRQIINKIVNDSTFREELTANPKLALQHGGFWESYTALYGEAEVEVSGYEAAPVSSFSEYCCITAIY
jgi:hypothetical protein